MKKLLFILFASFILASCGPVYNTALKQVQLGMSKQQVVSLMGDNYMTTNSDYSTNVQHEVIEYQDRYKFHWLFEFSNGRLVKWWKEKDGQQ